MKCIRLLIPSCLSLLVLTSLHAQELHILDVKGLNGNKGESVQQHPFVTHDGGVVIYFSTFSTTANYKVSCITPPHTSQRLFQKYDHTGTVLEWERCYYSDDTLIPRYLFPLSDNSLVGIGKAIPGWVIHKRDAQDNLLWEHIYDVPFAMTHACPAPDGGFFMTGPPTHAAGEVYMHYGPGMTDDIFVMKVDSMGEKVWTKVIGGSRDDTPYKVVATEDGGCYVVGYTFSDDYDCTGLHNVPGVYADIYVVRLDSNGNKLWHRCLGGGYSEWARDGVLLPGGGLAVAGLTRSADGDVSNRVSGTGGFNYWILSLDNSGNKLWDKCYGTVAGTDAEPVSIARSGNGHLWVLGNVNHRDPLNHIDTIYGGYDAWVLKLDAAGNYLGSRVLGTPYYDKGNMIAVLGDGSILAGGGYGGAGNNGTMPSDFYGDISDGFLVKLAPWTTDVEEAAGNAAGPALDIYPNPARRECTVHIRGRGKGWLLVVNSAGQPYYRERERVRGESRVTLHTAPWPAGVYYVSWVPEKGEKITRQLARL